MERGARPDRHVQDARKVANQPAEIERGHASWPLTSESYERLSQVRAAAGGVDDFPRERGHFGWDVRPLQDQMRVTHDAGDHVPQAMSGAGDELSQRAQLIERLNVGRRHGNHRVQATAAPDEPKSVMLRLCHRS